MSGVLKKGSSGAEVQLLQENLKKLGFVLGVDGKYGDETENAVRGLQKAFGYNVDGAVGDATQALIAQQIGYGWKAS